MYMFLKYPRIDDIFDIYFWHCRLGHVSKNKINRLTQESILKVSDCESLPNYEFCLFEKMTKSPFIGKGERANEVLGLIHIDVCGSMNMSVRD